MTTSFRYSYNMVTYGTEDPRVGLERIARCGYESVELSGDLRTLSLADLPAAIGNTGLSVSSISSLLGDDRDLCHRDPVIRRNAHEYLLGLIEMAEVVRAPIVNVNPAAVNRTTCLTTPSQEWEWSVAGLSELARAADGICRLAIEPWNRYETHLINTLADARRLTEAIDHRAVCVMADTFHMNIEESDPVGAMAESADLLGHVHFADNTRAAPGTGTLDFRPILRQLITSNYDGTITFELFPAKARPLESVIAGDAPEFFDQYTQSSVEFIRQLEIDVRATI